MERSVTGWITCRLAEPHRVETLRDHLYGWLGAPDPYRREDEPHLSVFGFRLPADRAAAFEDGAERFADAVGPWEGAVDGYHVWPSTRNPMVVTLDVPYPMEAVASPLADLLSVHGGRRRWGPTHPHVTLFKGGVPGEELQWAQVPPEARDRLDAVAGVENGYEPPRRLVAPDFDIRLEAPRVVFHGHI
ncbi:2'-5' RNA ligase family protein [Natronomonas sp.]|uniref:2'-5' RNA ligase family protein n=1 Tax=Natronomonas sp. TaxID=2184060 RepID=UPI002FC296B0